MGGALCKQMERSEMKAEPVFPSFVFVMATPGDLHVPSVRDCNRKSSSPLWLKWIKWSVKCVPLEFWGWTLKWSYFNTYPTEQPRRLRVITSGWRSSRCQTYPGYDRRTGGLDLFLVLCLEVVRTELRDQTCEPISSSWRGIGGRNYVATQDFHSRRHEIADRRIVSLFILISHTVPWCT